jgi:hypothetical protein
MRSALVRLAIPLATLLAGAASAAVVPVPGGYEVSYQVNLQVGTSNGADIRDVVLLEWDDSGQLHVDLPYAIAGRGATRLSHVVGFRPTAALAIGYGEGIAGMGDGKDHLFTLTSSAFAIEATGRKWSEVFPGVTPETRVGHNAMTELLRLASAGDAAALDAVVDFVRTEGARGAFDPAGGFRVLEWTGATPIDGEPIPTASGLALAAMALMILLVAVRRLS